MPAQQGGVVLTFL